MIVYGEYLFVENFITCIAITYIVGKILREKIHILRITAVGFMAGIYGFSIFLQISSFTLVGSELLIAPLMVVVAFGRKPWKEIIKRVILFFIITFLWGGITMALLLSLGDESIIVGTYTYMDIWVYIRLMAALFTAYFIILLAVSLIKEQRLARRIFGEATICVSGKILILKAMVDSGNLLKDPVSGADVSILSKSAMVALKAQIEDYKPLLIPYGTIDGKRGLLEGVRAEYIEFRGLKYESQILAAAKEDFATKFHCEILLNSQVLERGINEITKSN